MRNTVSVDHASVTARSSHARATSCSFYSLNSPLQGTPSPSLPRMRTFSFDINVTFSAAGRSPPQVYLLCEAGRATACPPLPGETASGAESVPAATSVPINYSILASAGPLVLRPGAGRVLIILRDTLRTPSASEHFGTSAGCGGMLSLCTRASPCATRRGNGVADGRGEIEDEPLGAAARTRKCPDGV